MKDFRRALRLDSHSTVAMDGMARTFAATGELDSAAAMNERIVSQMELRPHSLAERSQALGDYASACWHLDEYRRAMAPLAALHREHAGTRQTDLQLVVVLLLQGDRASARRVGETIRKRYGPIEALWRLEALLRTEASATFEPWLVEALIWLRTDLQDLDSLRAKVDVAVERGCFPDLASAVLGEAALRDGNPDAAIRAFASIREPSFVSLREYGLGVAALLRGESTMALVHLDRAVADSSMPREFALFLRGQALLARGDLGAARQALQGAVVANPLSDRALRSLGEIEREAGRFDAAASAYEGILEIHPGDASALEQLRLLSSRKGGAPPHP